MKRYLILFIATMVAFNACSLSVDNCTTYSTGQDIAIVVGGNWESGEVYTMQYKGQSWIDTLWIVPRNKDTLAYVQKRCPGLSIRNRSVEKDVVTWDVDSLVSHPEWVGCTSLGTISLPTNAEDIRFVLSPTLARIEYRWESCTTESDDDDDDDEWDD